MHIKQHVKKYQDFYFGIGLGVTIAGITYLIMRERTPVLQRGAESQLQRGLDVRSFNFFSRDSGNVIAAIEREGRGHPGYITRLVEEDILFKSQGAAARYANVTDSVMSGHLNGKLPDVNGQHYERIFIES